MKSAGVEVPTTVQEAPAFGLPRVGNTCGDAGETIAEVVSVVRRHWLFSGVP